MIRVLVVGLGSIGRRHLSNIRTLEPDADVTIFRHQRDDAENPPGADRVVFTLDDAMAVRPDIAFICGPSAMHADVGIALLYAGAHLFVEKPLATNTASARRLAGASVDTGRTLAVGYNLRFSHSLRAVHEAASHGRIGRLMSGRAEVGQYLPDWRPGSDYRTTNSARTELGGGIVFELSHEIDYLRWLLGEVGAVDAIIGRISDLDIDAFDTADLLLSFADGRSGNIHMNMTQRDPVRRCQIVGTEGTLVWDGINGEARLFEPATGWTTLVEHGSQERNAMYLEQTAHVFACARGEAEPVVDGVTGVRIVELAEAALRAARDGRRVPV